MYTEKKFPFCLFKYSVQSSTGINLQEEKEQCKLQCPLHNYSTVINDVKISTQYCKPICLMYQRNNYIALVKKQMSIFLPNTVTAILKTFLKA